ncbi:MAG: hypothetical protein ACP5R5_14340, partial [Armatimonadota bacterium]
AAVSDERGGLAVLTRGLCEACVRDDARRTLALTLFRGFEQRIGGTRTVDSQMLGEVVCEYAIRPFGPNTPAIELFREVEDYIQDAGFCPHDPGSSRRSASNRGADAGRG